MYEEEDICNSSEYFMEIEDKVRKGNWEGTGGLDLGPMRGLNKRISSKTEVVNSH